MGHLLVPYANSDEDEQTGVEPDSRKRKEHSLSEPSSGTPPRKKRTLPSLPTSLTSPIPESDPSKHQGRVRAQPHIDGQFASYVYVAVPLDRERGGIYALVKRAVKNARGIVSSILPLIEENGGAEGRVRELHVSLSRPVYLRHHQRDAFKIAVKAVASSYIPFSASFATFSTFDNDEKTRAFLALEVGAGHSQFCEMAKALTPTIRSLYQKEYYTQPRFHASIAWALLGGLPDVQGASTRQHHSSDFPIISELPPELITTLTDSLGGRLRQCGVFDVTQIRVRIGKEITAYPLRGH